MRTTMSVFDERRIDSHANDWLPEARRSSPNGDIIRIADAAQVPIIPFASRMNSPADPASHYFSTGDSAASDAMPIGQLGRSNRGRKPDC
jgi:hypothetical protein